MRSCGSALSSRARRFTRLCAQLASLYSPHLCRNLYALEVDPTPERDLDADGGDGPEESLLTDIASSIPGIDEAMVSSRGDVTLCCRV